MIPILFDKNETDFTTMGLGALTDCVSVTVKRVLNGQDELAITYPDNGARANDLQNSCIIMAQPEYKKAAQPYVVYDITKPVKGLITIYARHIRERTAFIPVMPFSASSLAETLLKIPDYCAETSPFTFWTDKSVTANFSLDKPVSLGNVLGGMAGSILDVYGGEYEFDGFTVKIWNRRGVDRGVTLRYGKNITDATQEESIENTITGVCPYWKSDEGGLVTLTEKVVYSQNASNFPFHRTVVHDFTEDFDDQPTEAQLRARAEAYISQSGIGVPNVTISVSYEQLEQYAEYKNVAISDIVNLGDTVTVIFEKLGVNATARVVQTEYDVLKEKYKKVSIGSVKSNLGVTIKQAVEEAQEKSADQTQQAIDRATRMITGANGGYLVDIFQNGERVGDMIMDTKNPEGATTNIWLRNIGGWGHSSTGINGQFRTAITQDGHIVADFIDTGTLTANIIKTGILRSSPNSDNYWNLATGQINVSTGGKVGGWDITGTLIKKDVTLNNLEYQIGMQAPVSPTSGSTAFYVGYQEDNTWKYPFRVKYDGTAELKKGEIARWTIAENGISRTISVDGTNHEIGLFTPSDVTARTPAFYVQNRSSLVYPFRVDYDGKLTATGVSISGSVTATSGKIGGWTIGEFVLSNETTIGNDVYQAGIFAPGSPVSGTSAFYVWNKTQDTYPFRVSYGGNVYISGGTVGGWDITPVLLKKDVTINNLSYQIGMQAPENPNANSTAFYVGYQENNAWKYPFRVRYDGRIELSSGSIGGWGIGDYSIGATATIGTSTYRVELVSPDAPTIGTGNDKYAIMVSKQNGALWNSRFSVSYDGKLSVTDINVNGTISGGTISGTTVSYEAEKTFQKIIYTYNDRDTVEGIISSGGYPTSSQLEIYDFNQDGHIDSNDLAILNHMLGSTDNYVVKTGVTISPTETENPIKIRRGKNYSSNTVTLADRAVIGAEYVKTGSYLVLNPANTNVVGSFNYEGVKIYDSSRRLRMKLDSTGLYFYNTSGAVTNSYLA